MPVRLALEARARLGVRPERGGPAEVDAVGQGRPDRLDLRDDERAVRPVAVLAGQLFEPGRLALDPVHDRDVDGRVAAPHLRRDGLGDSPPTT